MDTVDVCLESTGVAISRSISDSIGPSSYENKCSGSTKVSIDGIRTKQELPMFIMPRHIRLASASYAMSSDADMEDDSSQKTDSHTGNKRARISHTDFWSRVDAGEIKIKGAIDTWSNIATSSQQSPVNTNLPNYAISTTNLSDYSYKTTPFGDVYYSPRFNDNKYTYRFVILTRGVRNEAYRILKSCGRHFLTEMQIIHQLGIDLSPGWEHFMVFRNKLEELILRRPLGS
ncbi:Cyclin-dependent kinase regulatory subunit family protein [Babesia bovis T2Bo]|uniref:Cyclin-dependent kinases regulatory subunit n=1 Tax=Babesia bovis TaxID=5865 RepID=A7AW90_BABBO|nr:Cyclin-dependent kinase regulatory subunit family protein [Babesia bovis T2Bo]EDO05318.1 Cyclin-dependent kinase regulatory subunit family protein [Babesia bovis T2Bo]|eukprot:XP_001608886.1 hypothetical protein [Babesia bovis T2Bo]